MSAEEPLSEEDTPSCARCGHTPSCGFASVSVGDSTSWYCHADDHSCYGRADDQGRAVARSATVTEMSEQVMVRLTPELLAQLRAAAEDEERTVSQTVRLAIKMHLGKKSAR